LLLNPLGAAGAVGESPAGPCRSRVVSNFNAASRAAKDSVSIAYPEGPGRWVGVVSPSTDIQDPVNRSLMKLNDTEKAMAEVKEAPKPKTEVAKGQGQTTELERRPSTGDGNPLSLMFRFADEMDRVFEDFGMRLPSIFGRGREMMRREIGLIPSEWSPRVNIRESEGKLLVSADLPGLSKDDINVELNENMLTIQGERKQEKKEERRGYAYSECTFGSFYRAIPLPEGVDSSKATAEFRNGVLEIAMPAPRREENQPRRLEVQEKK